MKVALVIISNSWGGAEKFVYDLARVIKQVGHKVSILANSEVIGHYKTLEGDGLYIFDLGKAFISPKLHRIPFIKAIPRYYTYIILRKKLFSVILQEEFDAIHFNHPLTLLLYYALRYKLPEHRDVPKMIYTAHGLDFKMNRISETLLPKAAIRGIFNTFDVIVTPSKFLMRELKNSGVVTNIRVIPNGIYYEELWNLTRQHQYKQKKGEFWILFPGGTKRVKGGTKVLGASKAVIKWSYKSAIKFIIAGPIHNIEEYLQKVKTDGLEKIIKIIGFVPKEQYYGLLSASDVLLLPSLYENFPMTILEAMALGKSIIASNVGGIPEIVESNHNGYLCHCTPEEIADIIRFLYENPKVRKRIGRINQERVRKFQWSVVMKRYLDSYRRNGGKFNAT